MNKRTTARAARIFSLALVAMIDNVDAGTDEQNAVLQAAIDDARAKLDAMGLSLGDVSTLALCIDAAKKREA